MSSEDFGDWRVIVPLSEDEQEQLSNGAATKLKALAGLADATGEEVDFYDGVGAAINVLLCEENTVDQVQSQLAELLDDEGVLKGIRAWLEHEIATTYNEKCGSAETAAELAAALADEGEDTASDAPAPAIQSVIESTDGNGDSSSKADSTQEKPTSPAPQSPRTTAKKSTDLRDYLNKRLARSKATKAQPRSQVAKRKVTVQSGGSDKRPRRENLLKNAMQGAKRDAQRAGDGNGDDDAEITIKVRRAPFGKKPNRVVKTAQADDIEPKAKLKMALDDLPPPKEHDPRAKNINLGRGSTEPRPSRPNSRPNPVPCRYGVRCTNPKCLFRHPSRGGFNTNQRGTKKTEEKKPLVLGRAAYDIAEKEAEEKKQRQLEQQEKAKAAAKDGNAAADDDDALLPPPIAKIDAPCRYGIRCSNPYCRFEHPDAWIRPTAGGRAGGWGRGYGRGRGRSYGRGYGRGYARGYGRGYGRGNWHSPSKVDAASLKWVNPDQGDQKLAESLPKTPPNEEVAN